MKIKLLLFVMIQTICFAVSAQTTHYGVASGLLGDRSSYFGLAAGQLALATSADNSFFGHGSGMMTKSTFNCGFGTFALFSNIDGAANTAIGYKSLYSTVKGNYNTGVGYNTLYATTTGYSNTATGSFAMNQNTTGWENTATGSFALLVNSTGDHNTATGAKALWANKTGMSNTATGASALEANDGGYWNTATGVQALYKNISGTQNTATGLSAAFANTRGYLNTADGWNALKDNEVGNMNSAFGANAGSSVKNLDNTTALGYGAAPTSSNSVRIGNISVTSIGGYALWTTLSDGRFKKNVKEDITGLEFVNRLRPVSYEVDKAAVNKHMNIPDSVSRLSLSTAKAEPVREIGFIAQEVEAVVKKAGFVFNGVEAPQNDTDHYSIRYAAFVVPLVKAVQELTTKLTEQQLEIDELKEKLEVSGKSDQIGGIKSAALFQNTPNPFTLDTEIKMELPETTRQASVMIYNMEGKELKSMVVSQRGSAAIKISANDLSAGMYLYALIVDGKVVDTKRLVLTK